MNTTNQGLSPEKKDKPIGDKILAPLAWTAKSLAWVTNPTGGARFALYGLSIYCAALSVESMMVSLPRITGQTQNKASDVRFVPKVGIRDGANVMRLVNPMPLLSAATDGFMSMLPFYVKSGTREYSVWTDPNYYMALLIAIAIQAVEARALRAVSLKVRKKRLDDVAKHEVPDLNPKAVHIAKVRAAEYKNAGIGSYAMNGLVVVGAYALEIGAFFGSIAGGMGLAQCIYGLVTIFGFEFAWNLAEKTEKDLEVKE